MPIMSFTEQGHFFTPDEVNALIPRMEEHFQRFWVYRQNAQTLLTQLRQNYRDPAEISAKDVVAQQIAQSQAHFLLAQAQQEIDQIIDLGCLVKDFEIGLVDFPHLLGENEDEVYLCWKYGEKRVRFWHNLEEGFTNRKPLGRRFTPFQF